MLLILLDHDLIIDVGALGRTTFKKGSYVYVGSAQNNLEKRVQRHIRKEKKLFWHIDYLLNSNDTKILNIFYKSGRKSEECTVANEIGKRGDPIGGFGCSDCNCTSHLFHIDKENSEFNLGFMEKLEKKKLVN